MSRFKLWPFWIILILMWIPLSQQVLNFAKVYRLNGEYEKFEKPVLASTSWFDKDFQQQFENYQNQQFGFRNIFVRLRNELDWMFFKKINAHRVIAGKDNFLFERGYLHSYLGTDYIGDSAAATRAAMLKTAYDYFGNRGLPIITAIGPGKAWYYPELIPEHLKSWKREKTNYQQFTTELRRNGVPFIDFNQYFMNERDSMGVFFYPKTGVHWSSYGAAMAFDSIINYARRQLQIDIPAYEILRTDSLQTEIQKGDDDLEDLMNLLVDMPNYPMIYPIYQADSSAPKPRLLVISDSFFFAVWPYARELFNVDYYYYYHLDPDDSDWDFEKNFDQWVENYDLILLLGTEAGLITFPWGFLQDVDSARQSNQIETVRITPPQSE